MIVGCAPGNIPSTMIPRSSGLGFLPDKAERNTQFRYYQPKAGSKWRDNWAAKLDLIGVSPGDVLLLETHTTSGPGGWPFYGDPHVQAAILVFGPPKKSATPS